MSKSLDFMQYSNWGSAKYASDNNRPPVRTSANNSGQSDSEYDESSGVIQMVAPQLRKAQPHVIQLEKDASYERPQFPDDPPPVEDAPRPPAPNPPLDVGPSTSKQSPQQKVADKVMAKMGLDKKNLQMKLNPAPEPYRATTPVYDNGELIDHGPNISDKTVTAASKEILSDPDANPVVIADWLDAFWGDDWMEWEPETILDTAEKDGIQIDSVNLGKMFAIRSIKKTEEFFREPRVFEKVCIAFADRIVDWSVIQTPRVHDMAAAVAIVETFFREGQYSDHVEAYVAAAAIMDGFLLLPPSLTFAGYHFSMELASRLGDSAVELQKKIMSTMDSDEIPTSQEEAVQYRRLMRCEYHVRDMIDGAKQK